MPMHWFDNAIQLPNGIMCYRHRVMFVQWRVTRDGHDDLTSRGCPVCVGLIRAEVQRDMQAAARGYYHAGRKRKEKAMKMEYSAADIERAREWYNAHSDHVDALMAGCDKSYPMSGSDIGRPELWKAAAWNHFFVLTSKVNGPTGPAGDHGQVGWMGGEFDR